MSEDSERAKAIDKIMVPLREWLARTRKDSKTHPHDLASELFFEAKGALFLLARLPFEELEDTDDAQAECFNAMLEAESLCPDDPIWANGFRIEGGAPFHPGPLGYTPRRLIKGGEVKWHGTRLHEVKAARK
jgi:hypothetical protein